MLNKRQKRHSFRRNPTGSRTHEIDRARDRANRLENFLALLETKITGQSPAEPARSSQELTERFSQYSESKRFAWLQRPRLHLAIFERVWRDDEIAKLGGKLVGEKARKEKAERAHKVWAIAKKLRWSDKRLTMFKQVVVEFRRNQTIQNYLRVRRQFPEVEIQIGAFAGIDPLVMLENEFRKQGVDPELVAGSLDADEPSIDALCLRLMERMVEREKISKDEPGHMQKRRAAITDTMVNYLIVTILESLDWNEQEVRIPASLVMLIRHQLTGTKPDLHTVYLAKERLQNIAISVALNLQPNEKLSINKLASLAGIPRSTAARWLKDKEFKQWLEVERIWAAEGAFKSVGK